mmetsp:Transcript_37515/g.112483  ORF Transcript_37515/g.112483 Transcript_37515/m.112483 type:complete len:289 (-) Transcript_37515:80-946(-)
MLAMTTYEEEKLKAKATQLLLRHPGVPADFEALFVVTADASAVKNARETLHFGKGAVGTVLCAGVLALPFIIPIMCGLGCAIHKSRKTLKGLVKSAEADIYVYGLRGFATINNGKVQKWTPAEGMTLVPEFAMFHQSVSGPCGSSVKTQAVLLVRTNQMMSVSVSTGCCESPFMADLRSGRTQQVWFVSEQDMLTLQARVMASQLDCGQGEKHRATDTYPNLESYGNNAGANVQTPAGNLPANSLGGTQQQQQLMTMLMQQQAMMNRTSAPQPKATKQAFAFQSKVGA